MSDEATTDALIALPPDPEEKLRALAKWFAASSVCPSSLKGRPMDAYLVFRTGAELGIPPMRSASVIHVIDGKPVLAAQLIMALCVKSPDCEYFQLSESTNEKATYETKRRGNPEPSRLTYSIEDAALAGLTSKHNWKKHPAAMLRNRCAAALARAVYPDLAMGVYEQDEGREIEASLPGPPPLKAPAPMSPTASDLSADMFHCKNKFELEVTYKKRIKDAYADDEITAEEANRLQRFRVEFAKQVDREVTAEDEPPF